MPLSAEKIEELKQLKEDVEEAFDQQLREINDQVEFLRAVDVSTSALAEGTTDAAADRAQATINTILQS